MTALRFGPFAYAAPAGWVRHPSLTLNAPDKRRRVTLDRALRPGDEPVAASAWRRLFDLARADPSRQIVEATATTVAGAPAFRAAVVHTEQGEPVLERIAWIEAGVGAVLLVTSVTPSDDDGAAFEQVLSTLRPSDATAAAAPSPPPQAMANPSIAPEPSVYDAFTIPRTRSQRR